MTPGLLSIDLEDVSDSASEVNVHGYVDSKSFSPTVCLHLFSNFLKCVFDGMNRWNISTKYYTADVSVWTANLHDDFSVGNLPIFQQLDALVMVFDLSNVSILHLILL